MCDKTADLSATAHVMLGTLCNKQHKESIGYRVLQTSLVQENWSLMHLLQISHSVAQRFVALSTYRTLLFVPSTL
jgi:hypothetical protein